MKKISLIILLFLMMFTFTGCDSSDQENIIYNKIYNVTIDITEFQDYVAAVGEKCSPGTIGVANYGFDSFFTNYIQGTGSGFVFDGYALLNDGTKVSLDTPIYDAVSYHYYAITNFHVVESWHGTKEMVWNAQAKDEGGRDGIAGTERKGGAIFMVAAVLFVLRCAIETATGSFFRYRTGFLWV